ncbi:MAG TPA: sigma 54-interacting transcriptional regulator [candidate division Zixibacteria bacterium]|nr:sigma 54-interacting transcriptional regulator [candidate division Zixibacteria bacterium]
MIDERKDLTEKMRWLLFLRVVIVSFFLGATALFHFFNQQSDLRFLYTLSVPLILAYAISVISALALPRIKDLRFFAHLQVDFDVLLITGIIWITGDFASPFPFLYNLAVMNGAILLFYRGAFFTAIFSSLCYVALLSWAYTLHRGAGVPASWAAVMPHVFNAGSFFAIAGLGGFLAKKLAETEKALKAKQLDYQELDALKQALLQGVGSGIAITDVGGRVNYFNVQAQNLTGLAEETVRGKRLDEIFPGLSYRFDGSKSGPRVVADEISFATAQGAQKQLRLTLAPLSDAGQQLIGYLSIFDDITKQKEMEEKLRLEEELRKAKEQEARGPGEFHFEGVIGRSPGIEKINQLVQKVASSSTNVLIIGESGTGKELVARAIHLNGPRKNKPFVAVNCGAIPENLIESELFGHVRGAFTGAVADHPGLFKQADQGTIFLDEVGELPLHLQVKLLRVLQDRTFTPVGGNKPVKVDVRVISATNKDLRREMEEGRFREDLFYRLNVVQITMPPLRNRKEDIPALVHYFFRKFTELQQKKIEEISSGALMHLVNYSYPGNVRELENIMEHAVAVATSAALTEDDLPAHVKGTPIAEEAELFEKTAPGGADLFFSKGLSLDAELETHEKCILLGALKRANGVQKRAAEILGINYRSLRHRLEKYGMLNTKGHGHGETEEPQ